ncbi:MAG TPA: hypothetical protein VHE79_12485 [Spirochaetia bacterium]
MTGGKMKFVVLFCCLLFVFGCASTGPAFAPADVPPDKALIYLYRPGAFSLAARTIFLALPGSDKSYALVNAGYYPLFVDPGTVTIAGVGTDAVPVSFEISVKGGEERYVRVTFDESGLSLAVPAKFEEVPAAQGKTEIAGCTLISIAE